MDLTLIVTRHFSWWPELLGDATYLVVVGLGTNRVLGDKQIPVVIRRTRKRNAEALWPPESSFWTDLHQRAQR